MLWFTSINSEQQHIRKAFIMIVKSFKVISIVVALTMVNVALPLFAQQEQTDFIDRTILPIPEPVFRGRIGLTPADSEKDFPRQVEAPEGSPNVVIIMPDDVDFAASEVFGGPIPTLLLTGWQRQDCATTHFTQPPSARRPARLCSQAETTTPPERDR
ncbi:MAG: hypothetical protein PVI27_11555 [Desulfobacteraceae bacterium]|jgi:hypothetical protein